MGGRGQNVTIASAQPTPAPTPAPQPQATIAAAGPRIFTPLNDQSAQQIRDDVDDRYDIDTVLAIKQYISNKPDAQGYSMSQRMNYKLDNNLPLNANEQYTRQYMDSAMHDVGKDTILWRGAHANALSVMGLDMNKLQRMSDSQLNAAVTGATFTNKSYMSASYDYNKNPFLASSSGSGVSGGREVVFKINTPKTAKAVFGARKQAELVLGIGQNFKVTGAHFTGKMATPRNSGMMKQIQLDIEII